MKNIFNMLVFCSLTYSCAAQKSALDSTVSSDKNKSLSEPASVSIDAFTNLKLKSTEYRQRYGLTDVFTKLVDNLGNKFDNLYGVRNFRVVLHGVYYRGGANNVYNKVDGLRDNMNPLQKGGLQNLCEEGFANAIYLYPTNYTTAAKITNCKNFKNENQTLNYENIIGLDVATNSKFISKIYNVIKGTSAGPVYGHCWNGWHSSGYVASMMLKQFCGYSDTQALDYWIKNTDKNDAGYSAEKKMVTAFKPITKYLISKDESNLICP
jgi:hypothetical protein